jgi:hypothetical protein
VQDQYVEIKIQNFGVSYRLEFLKAAVINFKKLSLLRYLLEFFERIGKNLNQDDQFS